MGEALEVFFILFAVMMGVMSPFIVIGFIKHYFENKKEERLELAELRREMDMLDTEELVAQVENLRDRVKVLEAIVTDKGYEVSEKIVNLK